MPNVISSFNFHIIGKFWCYLFLILNKMIILLTEAKKRIITQQNKNPKGNQNKKEIKTYNINFCASHSSHF